MRIFLLGLWLLAFSGLARPVSARGEALGLEDCIARGLAGNRQLELLHLQMASASADVQRASAVYDTRLQLDGGWTDSEIPPGFIPTGGGTENGQLTGRIIREFSSGTAIGVELDAQRNLFEGTSPDSDPLYQTAATLQLSQSLWNNAFGKADRARVAYFESQVAALAQELTRTKEQVAAQVEDAYWAAWVARKVAASQVGVLERLRELREAYSKRVDDGLLDKTVLLNVDATLAVAEVDQEVLDYDAQSKDERLKELIDVPPLQWDVTKIDYASGSEETVADEPASFSDTYQAALRNRADIAALDEEAKRAEQLIELRTVEDRGVVELSGSIGRGDSDSARDESWDFDKTVWSVGIAVNMSLGRSASRADLEQAFLAREQVRVKREILEREIALDARSAIRQTTTAGRLVEATKKAFDLQVRKLEEESSLFDSGLSDIQRVLDYQNDRDLAERDYLKSIGGYHRAALALELVQGTLLKEGAE